MAQDNFEADFYQLIQAGDGVSVDTASVEAKIAMFWKTHDSKLEAEYSGALEGTHEAEAISFGIEDIPPKDRNTRITQLKGKLVEYQTRYKKKIIARAEPTSLLSTLYKRDALKLFLDRGQLNTRAFSRAIIKVFGIDTITEDVFNNACSVIEGYVKTGGIDIVGGTGLPPIKK